MIEPSVVMSGNLKTRKLMDTPSASKDRITPTVQAPSIKRHRRDRLYPVGRRLYSLSVSTLDAGGVGEEAVKRFNDSFTLTSKKFDTVTRARSGAHLW